MLDVLGGNPHMYSVRFSIIDKMQQVGVQCNSYCKVQENTIEFNWRQERWVETTPRQRPMFIGETTWASLDTHLHCNECLDKMMHISAASDWDVQFRREWAFHLISQSTLCCMQLFLDWGHCLLITVESLRLMRGLFQNWSMKRKLHVVCPYYLRIPASEGLPWTRSEGWPGLRRASLDLRMSFRGI